MPGAELDRVVAAIEAYLERHPEAADSADGIARWWLARDGMEDCVEDVRAALARLLDRGVVTARTLPSGERIYSAARPPAGRRH